ncbi:MAG: protein BatD, partial [Bacteroidia bacterium]|nr:protein BatD [Bacteroidia bacterium]
QVTYTLNANGNGFKAPSFSDFQFLGGPSQSTSMQIINGNMSQSISYTYYLAGKAPGNYTLSSAGIAVNGKKIESNSLKIEVTKEQAAQNSPQQGRNQGNNRNNSNGAESISEKELADNVFLKAVASKTATYQGEQIVVTYKLYRRIDVVQYQLKEMPKYNGFWKEDIKIDNQNYNESIDGIQYLVTDLKKIVLVPQRSGQLQVDPLDIDVLIRLKARRSNNFFDDFFGMSSFQNYNLPLKSKPLTINVKSLPDNAPEGFSGIVGNLSISGKLTKDKLNANESVSLKVTISGKGNLKLIEPFKLNLPEEIETYDPKVSDNIIVNAQGISGSKTFEYLLIPRGGGDFKIAPLSFGYFDAQSNAYKTISTEEFKLSVKGQSLASSNLAGPQITHKEDVKIKGNDIAYIKSEPGLIVKNNYFFG